MVWGKGGLLNASLGGKFPTLDFAGGTVVHISSGVSALVCALYLASVPDIQSSRCRRIAGAEFHRGLLAVGRMVRIQRGQRTGVEFSGHERVCGDALCGCRGGAELERRGVDQKRPRQRAGAISGAVAGLVAITPAAGFVGRCRRW